MANGPRTSPPKTFNEQGRIKGDPCEAYLHRLKGQRIRVALTLPTTNDKGQASYVTIVGKLEEIGTFMIRVGDTLIHKSTIATLRKAD